MTLIELFFIALGLSMDCFAVSLSCGASRKLRLNDIVRISFFFGLFQGLMTLIGWLFGSSIQTLISSVDHWIAFIILSFIGIKMIIQAFGLKDQKNGTDIRRMGVLLSLSIATSIDALITGISLGFIQVNIFEAVIMITIITFLVSITGAKLGEKTTFIPAKTAEILGGIVLILIGVKVVLDHMGIL